MGGTNRNPDAPDPQDLLLRESLDRMLEGIQIISTDWRYLYLNRRAADQGRRSREDLIGRTMMECYPGIEHTPLFRVLEECMQTRNAQVIENEFTYPDGRRGWFEVSIEPTHAGLLIRTVEISARKEAEEAVRLRTAELERSNSALEQYAFVASHDLRAPLRQVASFVQLLEEDLDESLSPEARKYMDFVVSATARLQSLVNDLLAYATIQRGPLPLREIELGECIRIVLENLAALPGMERTNMVVGPLPRVLGDESALRHVFQNLIENAVKFSSEAQTPEIRISATDDTTHWIVVVQDNGVGISPEFAPQLFQLFRRGHPSSRYPGRGIGLASCKRVIELYGGTIDADTSPGTGARFRIKIPKERTT